MRKYYINPKFRYLGNKIKQIPIHAYQVEKTFCNHRNTVELVKAANELFVIKRYKRPTLANCIIYTWFRKPKTRRAYENAFLLEKNGIETAEPVGYIEQYKMGFFHTGWFISRYLPYKNVRDYYDSIWDDNERAKFAHAFWQFTNTLCKKHILSKDYNTGNILTYMKDNTYHFAMIDINRLKLGKPSTFEEAKALTQLRLKRKEVPNGLSTYAELSQHNIEDIALLYILNSKLNSRRHHIKQSLKRLLKRCHLTEITCLLKRPSIQRNKLSITPS